MARGWAESHTLYGDDLGCVSLFHSSQTPSVVGSHLQGGESTCWAIASPPSRRAPSTPLWPLPRAGPPAGFPRLLPRVFRDLPSQPLHHWVPPTRALSSQARARWRCTHCPPTLPRGACGHPALSQLLGPGVQEVLSCPESLLLSLSPQGAGGPQGGVRGARLSSPWVPPQNTRGCNLSRVLEGCSRESCFAP